MRSFAITYYTCDKCQGRRFPRCGTCNGKGRVPYASEESAFAIVVPAPSTSKPLGPRTLTVKAGQ